MSDLPNKVDYKIAQMVRYCACSPESLEDEVRECRNEIIALVRNDIYNSHEALQKWKQDIKREALDEAVAAVKELKTEVAESQLDGLDIPDAISKKIVIDIIKALSERSMNRRASDE